MEQFCVVSGVPFPATNCRNLGDWLPLTPKVAGVGAAITKATFSGPTMCSDAAGCPAIGFLRYAFKSMKSSASANPGVEAEISALMSATIASSPSPSSRRRSQYAQLKPPPCILPNRMPTVCEPSSYTRAQAQEPMRVVTSRFSSRRSLVVNCCSPVSLWGMPASPRRTAARKAGFSMSTHQPETVS